jgi:hypothetical protein
MKNKLAKQKVLTRDLIKYSEQMSIDPIPRITFNPKEWDLLVKNKRKTKRNRWLGCSSRKDNVILVNLEFNGPVHSKVYKGTKNNRYYEIIKVPWGLGQARQTLVHELVHIKWKMSHGYAFAKRIDEILRGKRF